MRSFRRKVTQGGGIKGNQIAIFLYPSCVSRLFRAQVNIPRSKLPLNLCTNECAFLLKYFYDTTLNSFVITELTVRAVKHRIKKFMADKKQIKLVAMLVNVFALTILHVCQSEFRMPHAVINSKMNFYYWLCDVEGKFCLWVFYVWKTPKLYRIQFQASESNVP